MNKMIFFVPQPGPVSFARKVAALSLEGSLEGDTTVVSTFHWSDDYNIYLWRAVKGSQNCVTGSCPDDFGEDMMFRVGPPDIGWLLLPNGTRVKVNTRAEMNAAIEANGSPVMDM